MSLQRLLLSVFLTILALAPLPFGAVEPVWAAALAAACCLVGAMWVIWRVRQGLPPLPWRDPVLWAGILFACVGTAQILPLPPGVLHAVSPKAASLRATYEPAPDSSAEANAARSITDRWRPISLAPWATRQATLRFLACLFMALATIDLCANAGSRRATAQVLIVAGSFQAMYGLAEFFSGRQQIFGYVKTRYIDVATGTFINRNHFAGYLEMTLPLAVALGAMAITRRRPGRHDDSRARLAEAPGYEMFLASSFFIVAVIMAVALLCSRSRMGLLSLLMALACVALVLVWRGRGRAFAVGCLTVLCITGVLFSQGEAAGPLLARFAGTAAEFRAVVGRGAIWDQAASMVTAFPLAGVGLGAFPHVFAAFRTAGEGVYLERAHNDVLELAAETGLFGLLAAALALGLVLVSLLRGRLGRPDFGSLGYAAVCGVLAIAFHSLTDFNLAIPSNALTLAVLAGLVIAWRRPVRPTLATGEPPQPVQARSALVPAAVLLGAAIVAGLPFALRHDPGNPASWFEEAGRIGRSALEDLQVLVTARDGLPPDADAPSYLAGRLAEAMRLQRGSLRRAPLAAVGHLAQAHYQMGFCAATALADDEDPACLDSAVAEFRAALDLSPASATRHAQVARILLAGWEGLREPARAQAALIIERAIAMNRTDDRLRQEWALLQDGGRTASL